MSQNARAISFIRQHLKYKATKCYVGGLSGNELNKLWRTLDETEMTGMQHRLYCGHIDVNMLRSAFVREMSYNPVRFPLKGTDARSQKADEIISSVRNIIERFEKLWPNGISSYIYVIDTSDAQYKILRDMRDCFRSIAYQNMADLKVAEYRDEIVAYFADNMNISMAPAMRTLLQELAAKTAGARENRRDISATCKRISVLETQMNLHASHDREVYMELRSECDALKQHLALLNENAHVRPKVKSRHKQQNTTLITPKPAVANSAAPISYDDDDKDSDSVEREEELLRSMTPEHCVDETFQDYVEKMTGLRLCKSFNGRQH